MKNDKDQSSSYVQTMLKTYSLAYTLTNIKLFIGFPVDRLKTALQIDTHKPAFQVGANAFKGGLRSMYTGIAPSLARENIKPMYRTLLTTALPDKMNKMFYQPYQVPGICTVFISAGVSCTIDLAITTPFEVLKVQLMARHDIPGKQRDVSRLFRHNPRLLFSGFFPAFLKSYPAWTNLFFTRYLYVTYGKDNKSNNKSSDSYLKIAGYSMASSLPVTLLTTPPDVVKTKQQLLLKNGHLSRRGFFATAQDIVVQDGITKLFSGLTPRLAHKFMAVLTGMMVMDLYDQYSGKNTPSPC